jgi:hypothetical protein
MQISNYHNFAIVVGFLLGAIVSILKFDTVLEIVIFSILVSVIVYSITVLASSYFMQHYQFKKMFFAKEDYDDVLNYYRQEVDTKDESVTFAANLYGDIDISDYINDVAPDKAKKR